MPEITIAITTRDRADELSKTIESAIAQHGNLEIIIIDDGSIDDTEKVVGRYPTVKYHRSVVNLGLIEQRNRLAHLAASPIVLNIDDDAVLSDPTIACDVLRQFNSDRVACVALPILDSQRGDLRAHIADDTSDLVTDIFTGAAHAFRRDVFLQLGGYVSKYYRQGEETEISLRLIDRGYFVRAATGKPVIHQRSANRSKPQIVFYARRNDMLTGLLRVPLAALPLYLVRVLRRILHDAASGFAKPSISGVIAGIRLFMVDDLKRVPIQSRSYRAHRWLRHGPFPENVASKRISWFNPIAGGHDRGSDLTC